MLPEAFVATAIGTLTKQNKQVSVDSITKLSDELQFIFKKELNINE